MFIDERCLKKCLIKKCLNQERKVLGGATQYEETF